MEPLDSTVKVDFDKFVIELTATMTFYGDNVQHNNFNFSSIFINSAFACECLENGHAGSMERISEINIFSSYPFAGSGTTSDTLSKYFDVVGYQGEHQFSKRSDLVSFISTNPQPPKIIRLILKVKPTGSLKHKFTVEYKQTNGEKHTLTTPTIEFNQ